MDKTKALINSPAVPAALVVTATIMVLLTPAEATIGNGIKIVAIHVALIWSGLAGLIVAGVLGAVTIFQPRANLSVLVENIALVSLVIFALGVGTSLVAEIVNWGGIAWNEPRTRSNLNLLAFTLIAQVVASWLAYPQIRGLLHLIVAIALVWSTAVTELQLHPSGAVTSSTSNTIQSAFYGLTLLCLLIGLWFIWQLQRRQSTIT